MSSGHPSLRTPSKPKHSKHVEPRTLDQSRAVLVQDVPTVWEVDVFELMDAVLPTPPISVDRVYTQLEQEKHLSESGWDDFLKDDKLGEQASYAPLTRIFGIIIGVAESFLPSDPPAKLQCMINGKFSPLNDRQSNTSRPDGHLTMRNSTHPKGPAENPEKPRWFDIVLSFELKRKPKKLQVFENRRQLLWSLFHIMCDDARRRFTFGITMEDENARFWFVDRSAVMCSQPFNPNTESRVLIRIFLSLAFATEPELGYDATMRCVATEISDSKDDRTQYEIDVYDEKEKATRTFVTVRWLSSTKVQGLLGRATRVWEVYDKALGDVRRFALKVTWINSDRHREGQILEEIMKGLDPSDRRHFLTTVTCGNVVTSYPHQQSNGPDDTHMCIHRGKSLIPLGELRLIPKDSEDPRLVPTPGIEGTVPVLSSYHEPTDPIVALKNHRGQYRIVFEEVGEPIHDIQDPRKAFVALHGAVKGLTKMHERGYLHRDVSSGNILLVTRPGEAPVGVIMDVEYAKSEKDTSPIHKDKTGTLRFISSEAQNQAYMFAPQNTAYIRALNAGKVSYHPHPLNDLESAWWVGVWIVAAHCDADEAPTINQIKRYHELFPGPDQSDALRLKAFTEPMLLPSAFPEPFNHLAWLLVGLAYSLTSAYKAYESELPRELPAYADSICLGAASKFLALVEAIIILSPIIPQMKYITDVPKNHLGA